jgi:hypothetical protein
MIHVLSSVTSIGSHTVLLVWRGKAGGAVIMISGAGRQSVSNAKYPAAGPDNPRLILLSLTFKVEHNFHINTSYFSAPTVLLILRRTWGPHSGGYLIGRNWNSAVGIATGYELDDRGVGVRVLVGSRIFSSLRGPDRLWDTPSLLFNGYLG